MTKVTVVSEQVCTVDASIEAGAVLVDPALLPDAIGWTLKHEGLCREDTCVPVRDRNALFAGDRVDLAAVAAALGRPVVVDAGAGLVAMALPGESRRGALSDLIAPSFDLPDLDGRMHRLEEWRGSKKLLVAFASW